MSLIKCSSTFLLLRKNKYEKFKLNWNNATALFDFLKKKIRKIWASLNAIALFYCLEKTNMNIQAYLNTTELFYDLAAPNVSMAGAGRS